jgi:hypothetical protein
MDSALGDASTAMRLMKPNLETWATLSLKHQDSMRRDCEVTMLAI